jgi:hypothetical protein
MALITLSSKTIEESLRFLSTRLDGAIVWIGKKKGEITLNVPDPYDDIVGPRRAGYNCFADEDSDECGDVGIFIAVLRAMENSPRTFDARGKGRRKK